MRCRSPMTALVCRTDSIRPKAKDWEWVLFDLLLNRSAVNYTFVEAVGTDTRDLRCCSPDCLQKRVPDGKSARGQSWPRAASARSASANWKNRAVLRRRGGVSFDPKVFLAKVGKGRPDR